MNNKQVILQQKDLTKSNIAEVVNSLESQILSGNLNPLEVYIKSKYLSKITEESLKKIKSLTFDEIEKYSKEDRNLYGVKFSTRGGHTLYNYQDDKEYKELFDKLKKREEKLKEAVKLNKKGLQCVDENGEIIEPPSISYAEDSIVITFK